MPRLSFGYVIIGVIVAVLTHNLTNASLQSSEGIAKAVIVVLFWPLLLVLVALRYFFGIHLIIS